VPLSVALQSAGAAGMSGMGMLGGASYGGESTSPISYGHAHGAMQHDAWGNPTAPKSDRLVTSLKAGYTAIQTAFHGPGKPDSNKPKGFATAAKQSEKATQLIAGLEVRLKDFKTLLDEKFIDWPMRMTHLNIRAIELKSWLGERTSPSLATILADASFAPVPSEPHSLLGKPSPDFTLSDDRGERVRLADELRDGPVILVFYYGYWCKHCVAQLFALHQDIANFQELGARIIAISADPPEQTAERFAQYGRFNFSVLSDPDHRVAEQFGVWGDAPTEQLHGIFLIDTNGQVRWCQTGQQPFMDNKNLFFLLARAG
jgi:peroxiredoxin